MRVKKEESFLTMLNCWKINLEGQQHLQILGGKRLFEVLKKPHVFLVFSIQKVRFPEAEKVAMKIFLRSVTFTFVGDDAVADFLKDLRQAGGTSHLDVLFGRRQAPRPHRARGLKGGKLGHEDICGRAKENQREANTSTANGSVFPEPAAPPAIVKTNWLHTKKLWSLKASNPSHLRKNESSNQKNAF